MSPSAQPSKSKRVRVGLITLGCAKNLVDAEIMLGSLMKDGVEITNDPAHADVVIVNTCSFIDAAQEESVDTILQSAELREARNRGQGLVVSGCLPQRFRDELPKLLPEVDAFMGIDQVTEVSRIVRQALDNRRARLDGQPSAPHSSPPRNRPGNRPHKSPSAKSRVLADLAKADRKIENAQPPAKPGAPAPGPQVEVHARPNYIPDFSTPRYRLTPRSFAYVKIAEGCNHPCSFCIIPRMRGAHRSRPMPDIVQEVQQLVSDGVREINLISQDSTYYGLDLRADHRPNIASPTRFNQASRALPAGATTLSALLRELDAIPGDFWIRLLYTHPAHWTEELIGTIAACGKVARYVDIPLQHIHVNMLQRMRRETSRDYIVDLLARIRAGIPGIALRTTFIVGFPGETEASFESLLEFIRATRFERLGVFTYSKEDGTLAGRMASQVPARTRQRRRDRAMKAQHGIAAQWSAAQVGRTVKILIEREAGAAELKKASVSSWEHGLLRESDPGLTRLRGQYLVGRGEADAPDIDGRVYVRGDAPLGEFARVRIVGHTDYDLIGDVTTEP